MKKHSVLVLSLLTAIVGCSSSNDGNPPAGSAGMSGQAGMVATAGSGGNGALAGSAGSAGTAMTAGAAGTAGSGGTCDIPTLAVFSRSDTDQSWDDNDFSDVTLGASGSCPMAVDVTWPHEAGWENADPAESNHESTHFTIDSSTSVDLTNKKLSLTIELASDQRGPNATTGAYSVSVVSVSTFDRVVAPAAGGSDAGGASGSGGSAGGSVGGASGGGGTSGGGGDDSAGGTAGATVTTETGYTEAETPVSERATLRFVGDRATVTLTLPNKTAAVDSYDPTHVIKINIRIYSVFSNGETAGMGGAGGIAGVAGTAGVGGTSGSGGAAGNSGSAGVGGMSGGASGSGGANGGSGPAAPTYDYLKSQFAIANFSIKDASAP